MMRDGAMALPILRPQGEFTCRYRCSLCGGIYTWNVNGTSIPLNLTDDAYPNVPILTLGGGTWSGGKYVINPVVVSEPGSLALLGMGGLVTLARRRQR